MISIRLRQLKQEMGLTNSDLARITGVPLPTIVRLVSGQTRNPTWDVMLAISTRLDIPLDEFADVPNKRIIQESELNHMQKYRTLNSAGKQWVDKCLEQTYHQWLAKLEQNEIGMSQCAVIDHLYSLKPSDLKKVLALLAELD